MVVIDVSEGRKAGMSYYYAASDYSMGETSRSGKVTKRSFKLSISPACSISIRLGYLM